MCYIFEIAALIMGTMCFFVSGHDNYQEVIGWFIVAALFNIAGGVTYGKK